MIRYVLKRIIYMVTIMLLVSVVGFVIIQLPPGDYVSSYLARMESAGTSIVASAEMVDALRKSYGLDQPLLIQYFKWMLNLLKGDLGRSLEWRKPVIELLAQRLPLTIAISLLSLIFVYALAIPIGIYSATHQYSLGDSIFTAVGFMGLAIPNFILALILMIFFYQFFDFSVGGLFSIEYMDVPMSWAKLLDLLKHLPVPIIVIGTAGTAGLIRIMRGCLLDELRKQYVIAARAKGLKERVLLLKYPIRVAINPIISTVGWILPAIVSGETITAVVLSLPTTGPLLLQALRSQDMYLAASIMMFLTYLTVVGTFISDLLLVWVDPRIRFSRIG